MVIDLHNCVGCAACDIACPYGVVYFNEQTAHARYREEGPPAIPEGIATGAELAERTEAPIPYYNPARAMTYAGVRPRGVVEKCTFCDHRLAKGKLPWCVEACPAEAVERAAADSPFYLRLGNLTREFCRWESRQLGTGTDSEPAVS